ncbi:MAG: lipoate--protein ligase family protein [Spirochaetota bacterium]|nr:MAG: lipoate--protein ligase family protein [Spirochaetota bacterium]
MPISNNRQFRFIYSGERDSFTNMAMDEAILIGLQKGVSLPLLRIYKWNPPTITIGYFQKADDIDFERSKNDNIGIVRRLTGGRAVLHWKELTYSILFSQEDFTPFTKKDIFEFIATCLVESLSVLGIESNIAEKTRGNLHSADCFASPAQFEIESTSQEKLIGSAQVIKEGAVLQHGSIPYAGSYENISKYLKSDTKSPKSASFLSQIAGKNIGEDKLLSALREGFGRHLPLRDGEFTKWELNLTDELAKNKYSQSEWMFKR